MIYHRVRATFDDYGTGILVRQGELAAETAAQTLADKHNKEYSVYKVTEQRLGSYRPKGVKDG